MSASNWKPWYERVADYESRVEREEFLRGVSPVNFASPKTVGTSLIVAGVIAGYIGHRITKSTQRGQGK
jgi:hypothetical protein